MSNHQPNHIELFPSPPPPPLASRGASTRSAQCDGSPDSEVTRRQSSFLRHDVSHAAELAGPPR